MIVCPLTLADANAFVTLHHRHNKKVQGHKFSIDGSVSSNDDNTTAIVNASGTNSTSSV